MSIKRLKELAGIRSGRPNVQEARELGEAMYSLGGGGMKKLGGEPVSILPGREYWMGASSSPKHIVVTAVSGNTVTYRQYPFKKDSRIEKQIAADLIMRGSQSHLKRYGRYMSAARKKSLEDLLKGGKGKKVNIKDFQPVRVWVKQAGGPKKDMWRAAEEYGGVGGLELEGEDVYEINSTYGDLKRLQRDNRFEVIHYAEEGPATSKSDLAKVAAKMKKSKTEDVDDLEESRVHGYLRRLNDAVSNVDSAFEEAMREFIRVRTSAEFSDQEKKVMLKTMKDMLNLEIADHRKRLHELNKVKL